MGDKKEPEKRPVGMPRLYRSIDEFLDRKDIGRDELISTLLDAVKDEWFTKEQNK